MISEEFHRAELTRSGRGVSSDRVRWRAVANVGLALRQLAAFRGADGGPSLVTWAIVVALAWLFAYLFAPLEPALILVPPALTLAVASPLLTTRRLGSGRLLRLVLGHSEMGIAMAAFAVVGVLVFGSAWREGLLIDTGDHQYMMARAEIFYAGLRQGHWTHWTHLWQGGDTITDLYPIEANLLTALVHALSPAETPFAKSYTLFVLFSWWLRGVGVYFLSRRFASPVVAFGLGIVSLFDIGSDVWGGTWFAAIYFGMIHNTLALTFGLFATALQVDLMRKVTSARFVVCALLVALTACGHALGMLVMVICTFALAVATWIGRGPRRGAAWALAASCLGLALSAIWIFPFTRALASGNFSVAMGGSTYLELGKAFMNGSTPSSSFAGFVGLGLIAIGAAALSGEVAVASAGIACLILTWLNLSQLLVSTRVLHYFPSFLEAQPPRMMTAIKTVAVPCVAWLLGDVERRLPHPTGSLGVARVIGRTLLLSLLVYGPLRIAASATQWVGTELREQVVKTVGPRADRSHTGADYHEIFRWLADQRRADPSPVPRRALIHWRDTWRHAAWGEGVRTGVPIVDPSQVPSNFFKIRPREINARAMNDWNVRFVLTDYEGAPFPETSLRFTAGKFHVWEITPFDDRYVVAPPGVTIDELTLRGETIRFLVSGAPEGGVDLKLRTAAFPRWRARQDGRWLDVGSAPPHEGARPYQDQIVVHASNGTVLLTCDGTMPLFWHGLATSTLAGIALVFTGSARRRDRLEVRATAVLRALVARARAIARRRRGLLRMFAAALVVLAIVLGIAVKRRGASQLSAPVIEGLGEVEVHWYDESGELQPCRPSPLQGQFACGSDTTVDAWLVTKGPGDDSGESAGLWPGIRMTTHVAGTKVALRFGRFHLTSPDGLWIQNSTWNAHNVKISWGDEMLAKTEFSGEQMHQFHLEEGHDGTRVLWIEIEAPIRDSTVVFRGAAGRAPSIPQFGPPRAPAP